MQQQVTRESALVSISGSTRIPSWTLRLEIHFKGDNMPPFTTSSEKFLEIRCILPQSRERVVHRQYSTLQFAIEILIGDENFLNITVSVTLACIA